LRTYAELNRKITKCQNLAAMADLVKQLPGNCAAVFLKTCAPV
tara:strand:- start:158 stop:286 length:129 start_codon:yes stop_codon:yes gene_type:complete